MTVFDPWSCEHILFGTKWKSVSTFSSLHELLSKTKASKWILHTNCCSGFWEVADLLFTKGIFCQANLFKKKSFGEPSYESTNGLLILLWLKSTWQKAILWSDLVRFHTRCQYLSPLSLTCSFAHTHTQHVTYCSSIDSMDYPRLPPDWVPDHHRLYLSSFGST